MAARGLALRSERRPRDELRSPLNLSTSLETVRYARTASKGPYSEIGTWATFLEEYLFMYAPSTIFIIGFESGVVTTLPDGFPNYELIEAR